MAAIIYQTDKRTGITYAYHSVSHWDKEKKQSRAKRTLIGKVDPDSGEIVPTRKKADTETVGTIKPGPVPTVVATRSFYGATYLFDAIGKKLGIADDLKKCFPETYNQILSTAYYLILEEKAHSAAFQSGQHFTDTPMAKTFHHREVVICLHRSLKKNAIASFACKGKDGLKKSSGRMTQLRYQAIRNV